MFIDTPYIGIQNTKITKPKSRSLVFFPRKINHQGFRYFTQLYLERSPMIQGTNDFKLQNFYITQYP